MSSRVITRNNPSYYDTHPLLPSIEGVLWCTSYTTPTQPIPLLSAGLPLRKPWGSCLPFVPISSIPTPFPFYEYPPISPNPRPAALGSGDGRRPVTVQLATDLKAAPVHRQCKPLCGFLQSRPRPGRAAARRVAAPFGPIMAKCGVRSRRHSVNGGARAQRVFP
eukprot:761443-Hanusia_phi.AAC.3